VLEVIAIGDAIVPCAGACAIDCVHPASITMLIDPIHARICLFIARSFRVGRVVFAAWSVDADFAAHRRVTLAEIGMDTRFTEVEAVSSSPRDYV